MIQVGLNMKETFMKWLKKRQCIKQLCPYSRVIVAPIPPTKIRILNNRAKQFNVSLFGCVNKFWYELGFDSFLDDQHDLLDKNYGWYYRVETGRRDRIHFGRLGI